MSNQNHLKLDTGSAVKTVREAVTELQKTDSILTDIGRSFALTGKQLKQLGDSAFDIADKYGKTANDYLTSVQKMYQAGIDNAAQMAELSLLAQTAGGMDAAAADSFLIALASSNTNASGTEIGLALQTLFTNLQDMDNNTVKEALDTLRISMTETRNGSESLKMPVQLLAELADAMNGLPKDDVLRSGILADIGGQNNIDVLSAMLDNRSGFENMLDLYTFGMESAAETAEQYADRWESSLNRVSNTWQDTVHNILSSDIMTAVTNRLNGFLSVISIISEKLGSPGSRGIGAGLFAGLKNVGRDKMYSPILCFKQPTTACVLRDTGVFMRSNVTSTG